jgi:hypothetical protein
MLPFSTRKPAQKNRGPSRPNLSRFGLSRKPPIYPGLWGCFLFLSSHPSTQDFGDASFFFFGGLWGCFLFLIFDLASPLADFDLSPTETSLLESERVTAKLVRLREGQTFNLQTCSQPAMLFVADGGATFQAADGDRPARCGVWCFVPPYYQLVVTANSASTIIVVVLT